MQENSPAPAGPPETPATLNALERLALDAEASLVGLQGEYEGRLAQLRAEHAILLAEKQAMERRIASLETDLTLRASATLHRVATRVPAPLRRVLRRAAKLGWWMVTPHRMPERLRVLRARTEPQEDPVATPASHETWVPPPVLTEATDYEVIASSEYMDADWYRERYTDLPTTSDPIADFLRAGLTDKRDPGPRFSSTGYFRRYADVEKAGMNPLVHYERFGRHAGLEVTWSRDAVITSADVVQEAFGALRPLPVFALARQLRPRVTMVTDSIGPDSFFGGVGTAAIIAALWARRRGGALRIATLRADPVRDSVANLFAAVGITAPAEVEFCRSDILSGNGPLDVGTEDVFLTTSWWSTANAIKSIPVERIVYLLQEDERMFYPGGDDQLRAHEVMQAPGLRRLVNTRLLHDYLGSTGIGRLESHGMWFEPAFPSLAYHPDAIPRSKKNLFFYARPNNPRNLYLRGLEALGEAVTQGVLSPEAWNVHFVGKHLRPMKLPGGMDVTLLENLTWGEYAAMLRSMDLGLSLMLTPHPSYPPLDLAGCGAVAVTNAFMGKTSLAAYSSNIICAEPDVASLVDGLRAGVALAGNAPLRQANYERQGLARCWEATLQPALDWLEAR